MLDHSWERSLGYCPYEERDWFSLQGKVADARALLEAELSDCSSPSRRQEIFRQLNRLTSRRLAIDEMCRPEALCEPDKELPVVNSVELMLGGVRRRVSNGLNWVTPAWVVSGMDEPATIDRTDA